MTSGTVGAPTRRETALVSAGFFVSSGLGFLLLAIVARWLTPSQNAAFLAVWGLVLSLGSVVGSVEQEVSRLGADARLNGHRVPRGAIQVVLLVGGVLLVAVLVVLALPAGWAVVDHSPIVAALVVAALLGTVGLIAVRGTLVGVHAIRAYASVVLAENAIRFVAVLIALAWVGSDGGSVALAVACVVLGCFVWLPAVRWFSHQVDRGSPGLPWRQATSRVGALALANGLASLVLTGFPTMATLVLGGASGLAELFAVLTLARIPLVLFAPIQALTVPVVLRWMRDGREHHLHRVMLALDVGCIVVAAAGGLLAAVVGPVAVPLIMGAKYHPSALVCGVALAASCLLAAVVLRAAVLVALQRPWDLVRSWSVAVVIAVLAMRLAPTSSELRGLLGFGVASVVVFVATDLAVLRSRRGARLSAA